MTMDQMKKAGEAIPGLSFCPLSTRRSLNNAQAAFFIARPASFC
jgi:hypothetical protein